MSHSGLYSGGCIFVEVNQTGEAGAKSRSRFVSFMPFRGQSSRLDICREKAQKTQKREDILGERRGAFAAAG